MSKRWKIKKRSDLGRGNDQDVTPKLMPLGPLQPATLEVVTVLKQRETIVGLMKQYPNGNLYMAEGEFVWRAPAEGFAMMRFFVNADGVIDLQPELAVRSM